MAEPKGADVPTNTTPFDYYDLQAQPPRLCSNYGRFQQLGHKLKSHPAYLGLFS